jgi:hypothetical protein
MDEDFILATIVDVDQPVEVRRCRLVPLRGGARGALWRGLVWPVGPDDTIDIAGDASPLLQMSGTSAPRFGLIDGAEEVWLILDGSVIDRDAAASALRKAGVTVLRSGPWLGDPVDGVVGTGFVRFIRPSNGDLRSVISGMLGATSKSFSAQGEPAERARALEIELLRTKAELASLRAQHRTSPEAISNDGHTLARLEVENGLLLNEVSSLQHQLAETVSARPDSARPFGRFQDEAAVLLTSLRPDLQFLRDSMTVIIGEFADRRAFYRVLLELSSHALPRSWKKIHGAAGWWERHCSNGQDDSGRIYVRQLCERWQILVSHKTQQARDIAWLTRQSD